MHLHYIFGLHNKHNDNNKQRKEFFSIICILLWNELRENIEQQTWQMKRQHVTFLEIPWKEASVSDLYRDFKACDMTL